MDNSVILLYINGRRPEKSRRVLAAGNFYLFPAEGLPEPVFILIPVKYFLYIKNKCMKPLKIFDLIVTSSFDKHSFFILVDCDNSFSDHYKDNLWEKFQYKCSGSLVKFYKSLSTDTTYHRHAKKSINIYFDSKVIMHLDECGVDVFKQIKNNKVTNN